MDCTRCLKDKSSQKTFRQVMGYIKDSIKHSKLFILFNKTDIIRTQKESKKFLNEQRDKIDKILFNEFKIKTVEFINISANNLLNQRYIQLQNVEFLQKNSEIMDGIYVYAQSFLPMDEIEDIQDTHTIKEQLEYIKIAMDKRNERRKKNNNNNKNKKPNYDENYKFQETLLQLRRPVVLKRVIMNYLTNLKLDQSNLISLDILFNCIDCCLKRDPEDESEAQFKNELKKQLLEEKLIPFLCNKINTVYYGHFECIGRCFEWLQHFRSKMITDNDIEKVVDCLMTKKIITNGLLNYLNKQRLDKNRLSSHVYSVIVEYYIKKQVSNFIQPRMSENYTANDYTKEWHETLRSDSGSGSIYNQVNGISSLIYTIKNYMTDIDSGTGSNNNSNNNSSNNSNTDSNIDDSKQNKQIGGGEGEINPGGNNNFEQRRILIENTMIMYLIEILIRYNKKEKIGNDFCRAVDLLYFYFDRNEIRQMFDYQGYEEICGKKIHRKDPSFQLLLSTLHQFKHQNKNV